LSTSAPKSVDLERPRLEATAPFEHQYENDTMDEFFHRVEKSEKERYLNQGGLRRPYVA
jgi:hypothetical protein